jgi:hypothetical protein
MFKKARSVRIDTRRFLPPVPLLHEDFDFDLSATEEGGHDPSRKPLNAPFESFIQKRLFIQGGLLTVTSPNFLDLFPLLRLLVFNAN